MLSLATVALLTLGVATLSASLTRAADPPPAAADAPADKPADSDEVFSGPQVGEATAPFIIRGVFDDLSGQDLDPVTLADGKPLVLVFVHQVTRPSVALTRALSRYAHAREKDDLKMGIVWLAADPAEAEQYLVRARKSLGFETPVGIYRDGVEGPGDYGLNRDVALTILVANENKVVANFALIQPSIEDAPTVLKEVVALVGGEVPSLERLQGGAARRKAER